jgi:hypothetical protein
MLCQQRQDEQVQPGDRMAARAMRHVWQKPFSPHAQLCHVARAQGRRRLRDRNCRRGDAINE